VAPGVGPLQASEQGRGAEDIPDGRQFHDQDAVAHGIILITSLTDPFEFAGPVPDKMPAVQTPEKGHLFFTTEAQKIKRGVAVAQ
jgi:hypothetical protein